MLDEVQFSQNHVQTNAGFVSAGWVSAGFIAERLAQEGAQGLILFEDACLHLIAVNYLLHNMGFFVVSQHGAFDLKISIETLMSSWTAHCETWTEASPPEYVAPHAYFRIMESTALLGTCWRFKQTYDGNTRPQLGLVRGMTLIYPSSWMLTIHWLGRSDPVHFDRRDLALLDIAVADFSDEGRHNAVLLPYPPRLPMPSRPASITG